jgi:SAM-dependent methyltransferase
MDHYTQSTQDWLNERFRRTDELGTYHAHQPIYGFRKGHCDEGGISRYVVTFQILSALARLRFNSLLDVGGAEGYKSALIRKLFGARVLTSDLSEEACKRAREIYGIEGRAVDIHKLPFYEGEFDVVLCSEVLEHVTDLQAATMELLRVASKAVVITVPHEPPEIIDANIRHGIPHAHIHSLTPQSFDFARRMLASIECRRMVSTRLRLLRKVLGAEDGSTTVNPRMLAKAYSAAVPFLQSLCGRRTAGLVIKLDELLCKHLDWGYENMLFTLTKDIRCISQGDVRRIKPREVIEFSVPYYYLKP